MARDTATLLKAVQVAGWTVQTLTKHNVAISPDGTRVVLAKTPSDRRGLLNTRARLRRAGCAI